MSHNVDNYYRAVGTYRDNKLDTNLMNILPLKRFDIVELSYRAVETRLYMVNILI